MIAIGLDTATDRLSVAAGEPGGRVVERSLAGARRHTAGLVGLVDATLGEIGASVDQVEALAVSDGPGSFTGLRVAAAWAKAVVRVRGIALWSASTLLVRAVPHCVPGRLVMAVGSAMRGALFVAGYRADGLGRIETVLGPVILEAERPLPGHLVPDVVVGDLEPGLLSRWPWNGSPQLIDGAAGSPNAAHLVHLIGRPGGAGRVEDPGAWEPEYGRLAEAQVRWEEAHGRPLADSPRHRR